MIGEKMKKEYDENSIVTLNARQAIRESYGMYIGSNDTVGMHHLLEEIVSNSMDEASAGFGKKIIVKVQSDNNNITVSDCGRGIPFRKNRDGKYAIIEMCTQIHSGGKFEGADNYKSALGLHGVGATVTQSLSDYFSIISKREDGECKLVFENGIQTILDIKDTKNTKSSTGTEISFIPDCLIFSKCKWDKNKILEMLQLHALLNNGIEFVLCWNSEEPIAFLYKNGLKDMLKLKIEDAAPITSIIYQSILMNPGSETECEVDLAIQYVNDGSEHIYAFTNGGYNPEYGTHVTGFKTAFTSLINNKAKEMKLLDTSEENIDGNLLRKGMYAVISVKMKERPQFSSQTKTKLMSPSARATTSQATAKLNIGTNDIEAIIKKALLEKKSEESAQRKREAINKIASGGKNLNSIRDLPSKLTDCNEHKNAELWLCEGDSAAGSTKTARDPKYQAVMPLRGKVLNTCSRDLVEALNNKEIRDIVTAMGTGIGDRFNINNLRYDKIIIESDMDEDGKHINLLLCTLFLYHLPEIVTSGHLYRSISPFYAIDKGKERVYFYNDSELGAYISKNGQPKNVIRFKGLGELSPAELVHTTLNPKTRHLEILTTENLGLTLELFDKLMGKSAMLRREFILENTEGEIENEYR